MDKPFLYGTGLSGLVGSRCVDLLNDRYTSKNLDIRDGIDITKIDDLSGAVQDSGASALIHMAAITDANKAWEERGNKDGIVYAVNVGGTKNVVEVAASRKIHLVHISTAFVFSGEKEGMYAEDDARDPIEWYGETKALAERIVEESTGSWTILRIDQPFRQDKYLEKPDTTRKIIEALQQKRPLTPFTNHWFSPTSIEHLATVLDWVVRVKPNGIFHFTVNQKVSDHEYALLVKKALSLPGEIQKGDLDQYLKTLARPYQRNTALSSEKLLRESGLKFPSLEETLKQILV